MLKKLLFVALTGLFSQLFLPNVVNIAVAACSDDAGKGVNWEGCRKRNLMLTGSDMSGATLVGANFTSTDMRDSNFDGANFQKTVLLRVSFAGSSAKGANFSKAIGGRVVFNGTDLTGANFNKAEMHRVDFSNANLTGADFSKSEVGRAALDGAIIGDNDFSYANLGRANFTNVKVVGKVNFTGAFFYQTRLEGLDLTFATGLSQWQIDMACGNDKTTLPEGLKKPESWPCSIN